MAFLKAQAVKAAKPNMAATAMPPPISQSSISTP
jgi:hypothetical protein